MKRSFLLFIISIFTMSLCAQAPQKMSYQAIIRDAENSLVKDQSVGMQISIVQGSADGTIVYSETQNPTSNTNGLISIEIGTGNTTDNFTAIDWSNGPYFVKTETDLEGGSNYTITGTSQLLSVPFALYANTSGTADYNSLTNNPDIIDSISAVIDTTSQFLRYEADASVNKLVVNSSAKVGSDGISIFEIKEITGVTHPTNKYVYTILPAGYNENNTRVLSVQVNYNGDRWVGSGFNNMNSNINSISYLINETTFYLYYPDIEMLKNKAYRILIMKVN